MLNGMLDWCWWRDRDKESRPESAKSRGEDGSRIDSPNLISVVIIHKDAT